jgi:hypothetical protein
MPFLNTQDLCGQVHRQWHVFAIRLRGQATINRDRTSRQHSVESQGLRCLQHIPQASGVQMVI